MTMMKSHNKLPTQQFVHRTNHEGTSSSRMNQLYNFMLQNNSDQPNLDHQNQSPSASDYYNERAVALGAEEQQMQETPLNFAPKILVSGDNQLTPSDMILGPSTTMFNQPSLDGHAQVLASVYIDQFGNQQLRLPNYSNSGQFAAQQQPLETIRANSQAYTSSASDFYNTDKPIQPHYPQPVMASKQVRVTESNQAAARGAGHQHPGQRTQSSSNSLVNNANNKLSNAQLMALIDELKDFNSRQAGKIQSSISFDPQQHEDRQVTDDDKDNDPDPSSVETKHAIKNDGQQDLDVLSPLDNKSKNVKLDADDLERFARFLTTKEGANMRFQLGLDKDAPDDGDEEDDRDALLESKAKQRKAKPTASKRTNELKDLERKHSEVAAQMDKLVDHLTAAANKAKKLSRNQRPSEDSGDEMLARGRRDGQSQVMNQDLAKPKGVGPNKKAPKAEFENRPENNFAKYLIQQELQQDRQESAPNWHKPRFIANDENKVVEGQKKRRSIGKGGAGITEMSGGEVNEEYPKKARRRDHIALIHELQKARRDKSNTRSRGPLPVEQIVKQSLDGELGMRTESYPDGRLVLRSDKGPTMTLKLPKKETGDQPRGGEDTTASSQANPAKSGQVLGRVKLQSAEPLKDEYPISERVSDRLNKLNHNLDRYFNDGFLKEVENKAGGGQKSESHQADSSNINESSPGKRNSTASRGDQDFDVDVGIDGERDGPERNDDYGDEDDDNKEKSKGKSKGEIIQPARLINPKRKRPTGPRVKKNRLNEGAKKHSGDVRNKAGKNALNDSSDEGGSVRRNLSAGKEYYILDSQAKSHQELDPVDSESIDSPIGPDRDSEPVVTGADKKVASSRESQSMATRYGRRITPKFYEEPEW